jgi:hypothetical protein
MIPLLIDGKPCRLLINEPAQAGDFWLSARGWGFVLTPAEWIPVQDFDQGVILDALVARPIT